MSNSSNNVVGGNAPSVNTAVEARDQTSNEAENQQPAKLFIGGLSYLTSEDSLRAYFETFGEVKRTEVLRDPVTCRSRGFGFVTFVDSSSADAVLEHPEPHELDGRTVQAKKAVPRTSVSSSPRESDNSGGHNSHRSSGAGSNNNRSNSTSSAPVDPSNGAPVIENKLFVGGLFYATGHESLRKYFEKYGEVINAEVVYNRNTKTSRGFGFVVFRDPASVDSVLNESTMHNIDGRQVEIKRCFMRQSRKGNAGHVNNKKGIHGKGHNVPRQGQQYSAQAIQPPAPNMSAGGGTSVQQVLVQQPSGELRTQQMVRPMRYYETAPDPTKGGPTHLPAQGGAIPPQAYGIGPQSSSVGGVPPGKNVMLDGNLPVPGADGRLPNIPPMPYGVNGAQLGYQNQGQNQFQGQPQVYGGGDMGYGAMHPPAGGMNGLAAQMGGMSMQQRRSGAPQVPQGSFPGFMNQQQQHLPAHQGGMRGGVSNVQQYPPQAQLQETAPSGKPLTYAERLLGRSASEQPKKTLVKSATSPSPSDPIAVPGKSGGIGLLRATSDSVVSNPSVGGAATMAGASSLTSSDFAFPSALSWGSLGSDNIKDRAGSLGNLTEESASPLLTSTDGPSSLPSWNDWLGSAASMAIGGENVNAKETAAQSSKSFSSFF